MGTEARSKVSDPATPPGTHLPIRVVGNAVVGVSVAHAPPADADVLDGVEIPPAKRQIW